MHSTAPQPEAAGRQVTVSDVLRFSYNQGAKTAIKFEREVFGAWWQAAAQQCLYPGSGYDSAYCTYVEDDPVTGQRKVGPIILAMSRTGHNKDFKADYLSGGQA